MFLIDFFSILIFWNFLNWFLFYLDFQMISLGWQASLAESSNMTFSKKKEKKLDCVFLFWKAESAPGKTKKKNAFVFVLFVFFLLEAPSTMWPSWAMLALESSFSYEIHSFHWFLLLFQPFPVENNQNLTFSILFQTCFVFSYEQHMLNWFLFYLVFLKCS